MPTDTTMTAASRPTISTTTISSMRVKPFSVGSACVHRLLLRFIPVSDVGAGTFATRLVVRTEGIKVVLAAMRAGEYVLVVVLPRVFADTLDVATRTPVADRRVGRLRDEGGEALVCGGVLRVV